MSLKSNYRDGDSYTKKSKKEGYRSRASYKLKEILEKDIKIFKGQSVLDLGSFPGGWSQVASELVGNGGKIAAVDLQAMESIEGCFFIQKPIEELEERDFKDIKEFLPFNLVLSDMAPNISGIKERDNALMIGLVDRVLFSVDNFLERKGSVLIKVFHGESLDYTNNALKERFNKVKISKPKASRPSSKEIYIIGKELK
ncbi:MAG: RlmE family RNA methyltransferase [Gammaproteobacteria bacterium]